METKMLTQHLNALEKNLSNLESTQRRFLEATGIKKEIEKLKIETEQGNIQLAELKEKSKNKKIEKAHMLLKTYEAMAKRLKEILPHGNPYIEMDDETGIIELGWDDTPYEALSGSEKTMFDAALCQAFGSDIIIVEAAELDRENLDGLLVALGSIDQQVIVSTWYAPDKITDKWEIIDLKG